MTTATTAQHLTTIARHWTDLRDALGDRPLVGAFGLGLRSYLNTLEQYDPDELEARRHQAAALRALERDPGQLGERPIPIRLRVHETMRTVHVALVETADQIAADIQRPVMSPLPAGYPDADRRRREQLVLQDRNDTRRWTWTGTRPDAPHAALWLLARIQGAPGPFQPLTKAHSRHIARVAAEAARRVETVLDLGAERRQLDDNHPCPCGGRIDIHGGAGATPVAHCTRCGAIWTETGVIAA